MFFNLKNHGSLRAEKQHSVTIPIILSVPYQSIKATPLHPDLLIQIILLPHFLMLFHFSGCNTINSFTGLQKNNQRESRKTAITHCVKLHYD